jgi:3-oxoacyl-[acyl-carrier protein] reductase
MDKRIAVVTGAAQGLGWAISESLAQDGMDVVLVDRNPDVLDRTKELEARGGRAWAVVADLQEAAGLPALAREILARAGRCDVLVNNAGVHFKEDGRRITIEGLTLDNWNQTIAVNLTAPLLLSQAFLPAMKTRGWGRIINLSSRGGRTYAAPASPSYAMTKAGIVGLTRAMAGEYAPYGITCNCVAPGRIRTPMTDAGSAQVRAAAVREILVGRLGEPMEIGAAVSFLASDDAAFITGAVLDVNGGSFMA